MMLALLLWNVFIMHNLCFSYIFGDNKGRCLMVPDAGSCDEFELRYYFNKDTGKCEELIYGGCGGNGNNFVTELECEATCIEGFKSGSNNGTLYEEELNDICHLQLERGDGNAYLKRYYYDSSMRKCVKFLYSGSGGNLNNFKSKKACKKECIFKHSVNSTIVD